MTAVKRASPDQLAPQEITGIGGDFAGRLVHSEMAGLQDMNLPPRDAAATGLGFRGLEGRIMAVPEDEERRAMLSQPSLPSRIARETGSAVIEQWDLDIGLARTAQKRELVGPEIGIVEPGTRAPAEMPCQTARRNSRRCPSPSAWATAFCTIRAWTDR